MHRFILIAAVSLDGKISDNSKAMPDWTSPEDWQWFQKELSKCDAVIVGRKTFEAAKSHIEKRNVLVLSRTKRKDYGSVRFITTKMDIRKTLSGYERIAVVGGSGVYSFALANGLADELYLTLEPVLLGKGVSFTADKIFKRKSLKLKSAKKLNSKGTMLLHYQIAK